MGERKPYAASGACLHLKGITRGGKEVEQKADQIAYGHGWCGFAPLQQKAVDGILQQYGRHAYHTEAQKFTRLLPFVII